MREAQRVSLIVNNYNYAAFLGAAIDSALSQAYQALEVIVVDDGSTDNSREVIDRYGQRIKAIFKENGGQASSFNVGFAHCGGEVVIYLDADDVLLPNAVEKVVSYFADPAVVNVHWPLWMTDRDGRRTGEVLPRQPLADGDLRESVIRDGPDSYQGAPTSGNAWSRSLLERVLPVPESDYRNGADGYLLTLAPLFGIVRAVDEPLGFYRVHERNHFWTASVDEKNDRSLLRYERRNRTLCHQLAAMGLEANPDNWRARNPYYQWMYRLKQATDELKVVIPTGASFLLADDNQWGTQVVTGRRAIPFPEHDGLYAGPPPDDATAVREFERLRCGDAAFMVFGWPAFWWLDHYLALKRHLYGQCRRLLENDRLVIFDLRRPA
jgi:glycosyltransferase involved in cell wall biosynthesis